LVEAHGTQRNIVRQIVLLINLCVVRGFAQKVGNGHAARSESCNCQSSGTQQRYAISSAIALANCTSLL